jgi:hypothetical protein
VDFASKKTWALPVVQCYVEKISTGESKLFAELERAAEKSQAAEDEFLRMAMSFFDVEAAEGGREPSVQGSHSITDRGMATASPVSDKEIEVLSSLFLPSLSSLPPVHYVLVHFVNLVTSLSLPSLLKLHSCVVFVFCWSVHEVWQMLSLFKKENYVHFDTVCVNLGSSVVGPKETSGRKLQQNVMFVLVLQSPGFKGSLSVVPQEAYKKSDFSLWRASFGRQRSTNFSSYPGPKPFGFFFSSSFLVRLLSTFSCSAPTKHPLTLLEVPEFHAAGLLASVELGLGYLGYQPAKVCTEWFLKQGFSALKEANDEVHWQDWLRKAKTLLSWLKKAPKRPGEQGASSSSKKRKTTALASSSEDSGSSSESSESDSDQ